MIKWLARGLLETVRRQNSYIINGVRFHPKKHERCLKTQNSRIVITLKTRSYASARDKHPKEGEINYYGACRNMPFAGERGRGSRVRFPREERCAESPPTFICGKRWENRRKPVKMKILSPGVVFTPEEGISTSHVCLKGQQPIFQNCGIVLS